MRSLASRADGSPSTDNSPASGKRIDMIIRMHVVLPAPLGPMKPHVVPPGTSRSRLSTALTVPKLLQTPRRRRAERLAMGGGILAEGASARSNALARRPVVQALVMNVAWQFDAGRPQPAPPRAMTARAHAPALAEKTE